MNLTSVIEHFNSQNEDITITIIANQEKILVLALKGYLETNNTEAFTSFMEHILKQCNISILCLDLEHLLYISSTGVGALTNILVQVRGKGADFYLSRVSKKTASIISMLGMSSFFNYLDSLEEIIP